VQDPIARRLKNNKTRSRQIDDGIEVKRFAGDTASVYRPDPRNLSRWFSQCARGEFRVLGRRRSPPREESIRAAIAAAAPNVCRVVVGTVNDTRAHT